MNRKVDVQAQINLQGHQNSNSIDKKLAFID